MQLVARITDPTTGTVIALDPDIPPNRQRVRFVAEGANLRWLMDGKPFAKGPSPSGCRGRGGTRCRLPTPKAPFWMRCAWRYVEPGWLANDTMIACTTTICC
jgi:hypothetical protein